MPLLVQSASGTSPASASLTITLPGNSTAGNCLAVAIAFLGATTNPTGGTITLGGVAGNFSNRILKSAAGVCASGIWVCENIAGGQTAVAITLTGGVGSVGMFAYAYEFSGVSTSAGAAVDKSAGQAVATPASTFTSAATATTAAAAEAWVGIGAVAAGVVPTLSGPSTPWANLPGLNGTIGGISAGSIAGAQITAAAGTAAYAGSISSTEEFSACVLTLLPASGGTVAGTASLAGAGAVTAAGGAIPPPGAPAIPAWTVAVDWNGDGDFADPGEDISKQTLDTSSMTVQYGRDQARALAPAAPGTAGFLIDNASRNYSPDNASSPLAPNVLPGRPVLVTAVQNAVSYITYRGYLETYDVSPQDHVVTVGCTDVLARFSSVSLSTPLFFSVTTGQAVGLILDAMGWPGTLRDLDAGASMIRWWWEEGTDGLTALQKIIDSEGPPATAFVDAQTGNFCFRDRSHRLIRAASKTSQAAWLDAGTDTQIVFTAPFTYDLGWQGIINTVTIPVEERAQDGALSVVWQNPGDTITIAPGQATVITVQASDPFTGAITPDDSTGDWVQQSGMATAVLSRTSGQSAVITLTDSGTGSVISALQLRAYAVPVARTTQVSVSDATSIGQYGIRSLDAVGRVPVWSGLNDSAAIAAQILAQRKQRLPVVQVTFEGGGNTLLLTQQLARDLSDRITLTEFETGLTAVDFFIEQIAHTITSGGAWLSTVFGCEKAPATSTPFIFGDATSGKFNTGGGFGI